MDIARKTSLLEGLYRLCAETAAGAALACHPGCARCCTRNVTITTLEGFHLVDALGAESLEALFGRLPGSAAKPRFRPRITVNALAEMSMADADLPEEACDPSWTPCPLLENDRCTVYDLRPLACRSMVSTAVCRAGGVAEISEWHISVSTVFQQVIEHLDVPGATGNMTDVLAFFKDAARRAIYRTGLIRPEALGMPANRHVKMLMIPPEHRQRMGPVVAKIQEMLAG